MPNWCWNNLSVTGEKEDMKKFYDSLSKDKDGTIKFSFNDILPMPEALESTTKGTNQTPSEELKEKYGFDNWYDWRITNWGTKWDCDEPDFDYTDDTDFCVAFESAWAPPVGVIKALGEKFPNLNIELLYSESGMCFGGTLGFKSGEYYDYEAEMLWKSDCCDEDVNQEGWEEEAESLSLESFEHCPKCKEQCEAQEYLDFGIPELNASLN